jgi:hypothetical protein
MVEHNLQVGITFFKNKKTGYLITDVGVGEGL